MKDTHRSTNLYRFQLDVETAGHAGTLGNMEIIDHTLPSFKENAEANSQVIEKITAGLTAFNQSVCPDPSESPLTLSIQDEAGDVVAGLLGSNAYGWMRIDMLWVNERYRGQGLGTELLSRAEQIGLERSCHGVHLDTQSFQAADFYERLGYEPFAELDNYPSEHKRIYFRKRLESAP